tara:strand:+ start:5 stop:256 length:252 start_codon:yes stop_codon:yes gene_type:complete
VNKKKLVELADEVLLDVDYEFQDKAREYFEKRLCERLSWTFNAAGHHIYGSKSSTDYDTNKKCYESVKPVLDDCLDKILGDKQ